MADPLAGLVDDDGVLWEPLLVEVHAHAGRAWVPLASYERVVGQLAAALQRMEDAERAVGRLQQALVAKSLTREDTGS